MEMETATHHKGPKTASNTIQIPQISTGKYRSPAPSRYRSHKSDLTCTRPHISYGSPRRVLFFLPSNPFIDFRLDLMTISRQNF